MRSRATGLALAAATLFLPGKSASQDQPLRVQAAVQSQQVYVGQQFLLQVVVQGDDQPDPLDIGPLDADFTVSEAGGGASNSTSVSIVNGRMTRRVLRGYTFNYRLAARKAGTATIPSLSVSASGRTARTQPITLRVLPPQRNDDFALRISLSEARAYVGQAVTLTFEWFIGRQVRDFSFTVPLLDDERFDLSDPPSGPSGSGSDVIGITLGGRRVAAERGRGELNGRQYTVLRFRKILVPRVPGDIALPGATVTFVAARRDQGRRRGLFGDLFGGGLLGDPFGLRTATDTLAIPSNRPRLQVLDLPAAGRPAGFNGWIGQFEIEARADPVQVAVGEPITVSLSVRSPGNLPASPLPALEGQPELARDFRVPKEIGAGEALDGGLRFAQTLRAKHDGVERIPPIELPYFDPKRGEYRIARSEPIAIEVEPARVVTAEDAEGRGASDPQQLEIETSEHGIAHNYVGAAALDAPSGGWRWLRPLGPAPLALALVLLPPIACLGLLAVRMRGQMAAAQWMPGRSARARWTSAIRAIESEPASSGDISAPVLAAMRSYLGARLAGSADVAAAWTYADAERRLRERAGQSAEPALIALRSVFECCEAGSYAGGVSLDDDGKRQLFEDAKAAVASVEEALR